MAKKPKLDMAVLIGGKPKGGDEEDVYDGDDMESDEEDMKGGHREAFDRWMKLAGVKDEDLDEAFAAYQECKEYD
jgi:hypothetical protein